MSLKHLIFLILYQLCVGTFTTFALTKEKEVGERYYLYHGLILFVVATLSLIFLKTDAITIDNGIWIGIFLCCVFLYLLPISRNQKLSRATYFVGLIAGFGSIHMDITLNTPMSLQIPLFLNCALSSLLLGFSMAAMMLGHWYLTQPKMSISELKKTSLFLIGIIVIRFIIGSYSFISIALGKNELELYRYFLSGGTGTFILMRWIWGLLAPFLLTYFIWGTVKIRSTQSATGLLYVLVLFVLTGEILSHYLAFFQGVIF